MLIGSLVVLTLLAAVLVAIWPTIAASKSIWLKDGATGVLKLGRIRVEVGVSYLASMAPVVNYLITWDGKMVAEGRHQPAGMKDAFGIFPRRDQAHDRFPYLLTGEVVGGRIRVTLQIRPGFRAGWFTPLL